MPLVAALSNHGTYLLTVAALEATRQRTDVNRIVWPGRRALQADVARGGALLTSSSSPTGKYYSFRVLYHMNVRRLT